ncbi:glycosyltransferase family 2 protein [Candidatus Pelagibacter sp.]|nr:glycosyltransferase family 2 protein [Candidatus Pelagibacter sp.]MDB4082166.1 glycosyltransferase family 2 protein [Candidatus Pelagibacter sp.]
MKFSILITSYNKEQYIEECIKSCLRQTHKNFEIILCDNYSTDNSNQIFDKYKKDIKLFRKKRISNYPPINQIDLIKEAYSIIEGEMICLLDADDYFLSNKLETIENEFLKKNSLEAIFDLPLIKKFHFINKMKLKKKKQSYIWPTIINTSSISITKFFLRECIEKKIFEKFNFLEIDFRINIYSRCINKKFKIIDQDITVYRQVEDSIMSNIKKYSPKWWFKRLEAHKFMEEQYSKNNLVYLNKLDYGVTKLLSKILN